jgi:hypothetical protein
MEQSQMSLSSLSNRSANHNSKAAIHQSSKQDLFQMTTTQLNRDFIEPASVEGSQTNKSAKQYEAMQDAIDDSSSDQSASYLKQEDLLDDKENIQLENGNTSKNPYYKQVFNYQTHNNDGTNSGGDYHP